MIVGTFGATRSGEGRRANELLPWVENADLPWVDEGDCEEFPVPL